MWPELESVVFIEALVDSQWLERSDRFRLVVHDWPDHCEDSVHTKVARRRAFFVDGTAPKLTGLRRDEKAQLEAFYQATPAQPVATPAQPVATPAQPVATPAQPVNGNGKLHRWPYLSDESYSQFVVAAAEFWPDLIEPDLQSSWEFTWRTFDFEQKAEAISRLRARIAAGEDSHFVKRPPKYLENGEWRRPPRKAKPSKESRDEAVTRALMED